MSYIEDQRKKVIGLRDEVFCDPGGGVYRGKPREFILQDALLNLWGDIREDALAYFDRNQIAWWMGKNKHPTGHLLSSQVACINHLYFMRQRKDVAAAVLKAVHPEVIDAVVMYDGFVDFEVVGEQNYLGEKSHKRGANATSVDAVMVGKKADGHNVLVLIEWKYTEAYRTENKYIPARANIYDRLLAEPDCPINARQFESLYYEPFYQLMRQTLLGWKMVQAGEYGCDEYIHLHVIPTANRELKLRVTSPELQGDSMSEAWKNVLREPARYRVVSPEAFLEPGKACRDTAAIFAYLERRYWDKVKNAHLASRSERF